MTEFGEPLSLPYSNTMLRREPISVTALEQLQEIVHAPSVQMHDVPKESVGHHLGFIKDNDGRDEPDERVARVFPP